MSPEEKLAAAHGQLQENDGHATSFTQQKLFYERRRTENIRLHLLPVGIPCDEGDLNEFGEVDITKSIDTPVDRITDFAAEYFNIHSDRLQLWYFDEPVLDENLTPIQLNMIDDDVIEIRLKSYSRRRRHYR